MGLLTQGSPLNWSETKKYADHVRKHGIVQFLNIYNKVKDRQKDVLKWGDEVEYMLVELDEKNEKACLVLNGNEVLETLQEKGENANPNHPTLWRPEYGSYMIEGTPGQPYGGTMSEFNTVEDNMGKRRREGCSVLNKDETLCTITSFPRLGCPGFTKPEQKPTPVEKGASKSLFFPDEAINRHPRFSTLTRNIRHRRGEKVAINVPIFKDQNTPNPFVETFPEDDGEAASAALSDHIYMDAMGFGMGNCCLQVTFQACSISEARYLYDQLATFCPIMMALSAASPFYRGYMSDIDCRWGVISASVDDRTREERGLEPLKNNKFRIHKSRYDSIDSYLSFCGEKYNDIELTKDDEIYNQLLDAGIDKLLAQHIAHLFIRDPLSLFLEKIHLDDENESDHFENLQSTNWQTMRFKPPPPNSDIGWRVEFRPMEVQLTDFENAAYVVFIVLLTRVILSYKLDFLIPLSKVDDNMKVAQKRNAVQESMFYFKKDIYKGCNPLFESKNGVENDEDQEEYTLMSIDTIINGKEGVFQGLVPILNCYLENMEVDVDTRCTILNYLKLIKKRASGTHSMKYLYYGSIFPCAVYVPYAKITRVLNMTKMNQHDQMWVSWMSISWSGHSEKCLDQGSRNLFSVTGRVGLELKISQAGVTTRIIVDILRFKICIMPMNATFVFVLHQTVKLAFILEIYIYISPIKKALLLSFIFFLFSLLLESKHLFTCVWLVGKANKLLRYVNN